MGGSVVRTECGAFGESDEMVLRSLSVMLIGVAAGAAVKQTDIAKLCLCTSAGTTWSIDSLVKPTLFKPSYNATQALAIVPGPPTWGPEGSGCVVEDINPSPRMSDYQQWAFNTQKQQILWPKNSSMCLTALPPKPVLSAEVGLWFCGVAGFQAAQSFTAVADLSSSGTDYQLQIQGSDGSQLCLSWPTAPC